MATQTIRHSAEIIAFTFVNQYYRILQKMINQSYRFYKEKSVLTWSLPDGEIKSVTTSEGINEFIISSHFKDNKVEVKTIDSQSSVAGGVLVVVTACLIGQDDLRKSFSQIFFLDPQETGYYVLNDIFRFIDVKESSAVVEEKVDKNASIAPLVTESNVGDTIKEVSDKSETKVTIDDQIGQKPSITSSEKEKSVTEMAPVVQNEALKVSYASMIKQGRSLPPMNTPHNIVRVVADASLPSAPVKLQTNGLVQSLKSSSRGVLKVAARSTNFAQDNFFDDIQSKSIYIGGLPTNTTRSDLYAVVKEFGPVHTCDVQLKTYEDGYCCGFVYFQDAVSAQKAVQTHHIILKGREAYITFKRLNKGRGQRVNSPSDRGGLGSNGSESRSRPQNYDGHRGEGYHQQNYRRRGATIDGTNHN